MFGITKQRLSKVLYTTLLLLPVCLSLFAVLYHIGQYYQNHPDTLKPCLFQRCLLLEAPFRKILYNNDGVLFLLEPYLLMSIVAEHLNSYEDMEEFKWRFDLPMEFEWRRNSLTVGVFAEHLDSVSRVGWGSFVVQTNIIFSILQFRFKSPEMSTFAVEESSALDLHLLPCTTH